jgi:hypothetical protein
MTGTVSTKTMVSFTTYTADNSLAATYNIGVTATLSSYPYATLSTAPKTVSLVIQPCAVTSYSLTGCSSLSTYTVLTDPARTDSCISITQVPSCQYDSTVNLTGISSSIMTATVTNKSTVNLKIYTTDKSNIGPYNIGVAATLSGYPYPIL